MKKTILTLAILVIFLISCKNDTGVKSSVDPKIESEKVALVLEKYIIANETQNLDLIKQVWATQDDIVVFGTDYDESMVGWEKIESAIKKQFEAVEDTYISFRDQMISINETGNTAWFSEILNYNYIYQGKAIQYEGLRFTGVLEKINGEWLIVQSHLSIPGSGE